MRKIFFIKDSIENKISYFHLLFFMLLLPFDRQYSTLVLLSLLAHSLIFLTRQKLQQVNRTTLILQSAFFVTLVSISWSAYTAHGFDVASKQLAIFFFPLVFATTALNVAKYRQRLLLAFAGSCTITVLYLYFDALHVILFNRLPLSSLFSNAFVNHNFSQPIEMHATYLSLLLVIAIAWLLQQLVTGIAQHRQLLIACLVILLAGLVQLGSKSALIALFIITAAGFPWLVIPKIKRRQFLCITLPAFAILLIIIFSVNIYRSRYMLMFKNDLHEHTGVAENNARIDRWNAALDLVKKTPVAGTGSGSEIPLLRSVYFEKKMYADYLYSMNVHNQYLSFIINSGIAGLLIYLFTLGWGWRQSVKERNILLFAFMAIVCVVSFAEDMLDVNKGIFFYAFFFSFFIVPQRRSDGGFILSGRQPLVQIDEL